MKILITGGTGFIGKALTENLLLQRYQVTILSRSKQKVIGIFGQQVEALDSLQQLTPDNRYDVIINLAGEPIFAQRWSKKRKQLISNSRVGLTKQLVAAIGTMQHKPALLISGSAIGYYGSQGDTALHEDSPTVDDFAHRLCAEWEQAALQAEAFGVRVCLMRTGLVLSSEGGMLKRMLPAFRFGLGGRLGNGQQWMPWIDLDDWVKVAASMIVTPEMQGAYNLTAPDPVRNKMFTRLLAEHLHRPAILPVPAWVLKMLLGEMSELVLGSQNVLPFRLLQQGFKFEYPDLRRALKHCIKL